MRARELLGKYVSVRDIPSVNGIKIPPSIPPYSVIEYTGIVTDHENVNYKWLVLPGMHYVNFDYPPNGLRFELLPDTPPPPPPTPAGDPLIRPTVVPAGMTVGFVRLNFERAPYVSRPTMNGNRSPLVKGLPDTCPFPGAGTPLLGAPQQRCWWNLFLRSAPPTLSMATLKRRWASLTADDRAFTNTGGSYTRADWINGTNLDAGPMKFGSMAMGGSLVNILGGPVMKGGEDCWIIQSVDYVRLAPLTPYTVFWATNSCRSGLNWITRKWANERIEEPFSQLDWNNVPVLMFAMSDRSLIPCNRVRVLHAGDPIPGPYYKAV